MSDIAFLLLVHDNPAHVEWLADQLAPHDVYLHIDATKDPRPFGPALAASNVTPVERIPVQWAGFSVVRAEMQLLEAALSDPGARHFVLLSGACFPIRPVTELVEHLRSADESRIRYVPVTPGVTSLRSAVELRWFLELNRYPGGKYARRAAHYATRWTLGRRLEGPGGLVPHFGSQWWSLNRAAAEHVLDMYRTRPEVVGFYRTTFAPDEHFVQTVVANSPHARPDHLMPYLGTHSFSDAALHFIRPTSAFSTGRDAPKPDRLDPERDLEELRASGKFFARKLAPGADLDLVESQLLRSTRAQATSPALFARP